MRTIITLFFISFCSILSFGQSHYYSFQGELTESAQTELESRIQTLEFVQEAKVRYKEEKQAGEIAFSINIEAKKSENESFSPIAMKQLLQEFGLAPLNYVAPKTSQE